MVVGSIPSGGTPIHPGTGPPRHVVKLSIPIQQERPPLKKFLIILMSAAFMFLGIGINTTAHAAQSPPCQSGSNDVPGGTDPWGTCYPDATNTGTSGTLTQVVVGGTGEYVMNSGDSLTNTDLIGCVHILSGPVTINNVRVFCDGGGTGNASPAIMQSSGCTCTPSTITNVEVDCGNTHGQTFINSSNNPDQWFTVGVYVATANVSNANIHGCEVGYGLSTYSSLTDSYIHDLSFHPTQPGSRGIDASNGVSNTLSGSFNHNTVDVSNTALAAIWTQTSVTGLSTGQVNIHNNLLKGGIYTLACPTSYGSGQHLASWYVDHNRWNTAHGTGAKTSGCTSNKIKSWTDNLYAVSGVAV